MKILCGKKYDAAAWKGHFPLPRKRCDFVFLAVKWMCLKDIVSSICTVQEAMITSRIRYVFPITIQK